MYLSTHVITHSGLDIVVLRDSDSSDRSAGCTLQSLSSSVWRAMSLLITRRIWELSNERPDWPLLVISSNSSIITSQLFKVSLSLSLSLFLSLTHTVIIWTWQSVGLRWAERQICDKSSKYISYFTSVWPQVTLVTYLATEPHWLMAFVNLIVHFEPWSIFASIFHLAIFRASWAMWPVWCEVWGVRCKVRCPGVPSDIYLTGRELQWWHCLTPDWGEDRQFLLIYCLCRLPALTGSEYFFKRCGVRWTALYLLSYTGLR